MKRRSFIGLLGALFCWRRRTQVLSTVAPDEGLQLPGGWQYCDMENGLLSDKLPAAKLEEIRQLCQRRC